MKAVTVGVATAAALVAAALLGPGAPAPRQSRIDRSQALASLIEAERAFSRASGSEGTRAAFLAFLARDAVVFRPAPVAGRPVYERMPAGEPTVLTWAPEAAEVAASGELGYTTGPYAVRPSREAAPSSFGRYVSVWNREPDGTWKVLIDAGVRHDPPPASTAAPSEVASPAGLPDLAPLTPEALRDEEYAFGRRAGAFEEDAARRGTRKALADFAAADIRVLRPGRFPAVGLAAAKALLSPDEGKALRGGRYPKSRQTSYKVGLSWSGDLAWSYGTVQDEASPREGTAYLRLWRRVPPGPWRISLDLVLPVPREGAK
jgi:ketosteroid isomerase-like protein